MNSKTELANVALIRLGQPTITDFDNDESSEGVAIRQVWSTVRDEVQRKFPWSALRDRIQLPKSVETPLYGWSYIYELPKDCTYLIEVFSNQGVRNLAYQVESRKILTNVDAPIYINYIKRSDDPSVWDSLLQSAMASRLAVELAEKLLSDGSTNKKSEQQAYYESYLQEAKTMSSQESYGYGVPLNEPGSWDLAGTSGYGGVVTGPKFSNLP